MKFKNIFAAIAALTLLTAHASADPTNGPQYGRGLIAPGELDVFATRCNSDEPTVFAVLGDGDGDLDCVLLDSLGNEVGRDDDYTDSCRIMVTPRWTGRFRLEIRNNGRMSSAYLLRAF